MPLCRSEVNQEVTTAEDLGEIRSQRYSDVDNTPESMLLFSGNNNVHGLYDLLLNYKTLLTSLSGVEDVPVLCSPVPFQNSAMTSPNIKCMEMTRAEDIAQGSSNDLFYSIEIKDAIIPPWIICSICALMIGSQGRRNFEASFVTQPLSIGLNVALKSICDNSFGIPKAAVTSSLCSCTLKSVNYSDGSYKASLYPVV
jgi:protein downstream neighbor of Son